MSSVRIRWGRIAREIQEERALEMTIRGPERFQGSHGPERRTGSDMMLPL